MRAVRSRLSHPDSLRAFVWQRAETDETWESATNVFFDDGSCVIWLLVFVPFSVPLLCFRVWVSMCVCLYASDMLCMHTICGHTWWVSKSGSAGPVWSLIDYLISWLLLLGGGKEYLIEHPANGCITCRWASSNHAVRFWQPNVVAIMLSQYYSVSLLWAQTRSKGLWCSKNRVLKQ